MIKYTLLLVLVFLIGKTDAQNNALHFDGINDQVIGQSSPILELTEGTIELWVKPQMKTTKQTFIAYRSANGSQTRYLWNFLENLSGLGFWNGSVYGVLNYNFVPDDWCHLAFVDDNVNTKFYVNGVFIGAINMQFGNAAGNALNLILGIDMPCCEFFNGAMDEVRIWSTPFNVQEIQERMTCTYPSDEPGLVLHYKMNEGVANGNNLTITMLEDSSVNGFSATLNNFDQDGTTSNWVNSTTDYSNCMVCDNTNITLSQTPPPLNNSLHFDGNDNYAYTNVSPLMNSTQATIELWFKPEVTNNEQILFSSYGSGNDRYYIFLLNDLSGVDFFRGFAHKVHPYTFTPGSWYHIAVVWTGSNSLLYINGNYETDLLIQGTELQANEFILGVDILANNEFKGEMDEVRIWDKDLCEAEIQQAMKCPVDPNQNGLLANYKFDQGLPSGSNPTENILFDNSSNNNDLGIFNFILDGSTSNWISSTISPIPDPTPTGTYFKTGSLYNNGSTVLPANDVELISDFCIILEPGTDVQTGAQFHAFIGGCDSGTY